MKYYLPLIEKRLTYLFIILTGTTLSTWAWLIIFEGMNQPVEWWIAVVPAGALLACAFCMDASSTLTFGRRLIIA